MKEIWKTAVVDGVENARYKVSSLGRVICLNWCNTGKPRLCRLTNSGGYLQVSIDGVHKRVHRIVAEVFLPNPEGKPEVDHIDTNPNNNCVWNLRWVTRSENNNNSLTRKHMSENAPWLGKLGTDNPFSIAIVQLSKDGKFIRKWGSGGEAERELGILHTSICNCLKGWSKSAGGFKWVYYSDWIKRRKKPQEIKPLF